MLFARTERRQSPGLQLNLSSNNPFRNRAGSPNLASPASLGSPMSAHSGRPVSTNPFLSAFEAETGRDGGVVTGTAVNGGGYGGSSAGGGPRSSSPQKATFELFVRPGTFLVPPPLPRADKPYRSSTAARFMLPSSRCFSSTSTKIPSCPCVRHGH
ncbi:MAG: hypothetical protein INR71_01465 [Terriglobus roseus]|nr:hypothetical protein [Terriglobus roseus]